MSIINPFKGPKPYEEGDEFYGRDKEMRELFNLIRNEPLTLLFSRSGTGKSSLINAGLIPFLRKDFEFFPVYIHLSLSTFHAEKHDNLARFVIRRCEEEIVRHLSDPEKFSIIFPEVTESMTLFEFIHELKIFQLERSEGGEVTEYSVKPLLIFDQFEEVFVNPFEKDDLDFLYQEIRCLIENDIPDYLEEAFKDTTNPKIQILKNTLKRKQKDYSVLFSFREEFLPQMESLKKKIPFIRFTNSRFRLEPFTTDTAESIILQTGPLIKPLAAAKIANNLSASILGFDSDRVDPFLLSLICHLIYSDLVSDNDISDDRIKLLVDNAIESYLKKVYAVIGEETKHFIETRLITREGNKTSVNYNEIVGNSILRDDIEKLINNQEYRLLSKGQFLDSIHINILHDRLLSPLLNRRKIREEKYQNDILESKKMQIEEENRAKQKITRRKIRTRVAIAAVLVLFVLIFQGARNSTTKTILNAFEINALAHEMENINPTIALRLAELALNKNRNPVIEEATGEIYNNNSFYRTILNSHSSVKYSSYAVAGDDLIYVACSDSTVKLWNNNKLTTFCANSGQGKVLYVSYSSPQKILLTLTSDGLVRLWNDRKQEVAKIHPDTTRFTAMQFSRDGRLLMAGFGDGSARIWSVDSLIRGGDPVNHLYRFRAHARDVISIAASADDKMFVTASTDDTARLWDVARGFKKPVAEFVDKNGSKEMRVAMMPGENIVVTAGGNGSVRLWGLANKRLNNTSVGSNGANGSSTAGGGDISRESYEMVNMQPHEKTITSLKVSRDGNYILTASTDNTVKIHDCYGTLVKALKGHKDRVIYADFSDDEKYVYTGSDDSTVKKWNIEGLLIKEFINLKDPNLTAACSPEGKIVCGSVSGKIRIYNDDGTIFKTLHDLNDQITCIAVSADGNIAAGSRDSTVGIWNKNGTLIKKITGDHKGDITALAFSSSHNKLITGCRDGFVRLYDLGDLGNPIAIANPNNSSILSVALSEDGRSVLTGSKDSIARLYAINGNEKPVQEFKGSGQSSVLSAAFSPDGKSILTGSADKIARLWKLNSSNVFILLDNHGGTVNSVAFRKNSKDTLNFITASDDGVVTLWKVASNAGIIENQFVAHRGKINSVVVSSDGNRLLTVGNDLTVKLWNIRSLTIENILKSINIDNPKDDINRLISERLERR